jgi:spore maturation protein CgeB
MLAGIRVCYCKILIMNERCISSLKILFVGPLVEGGTTLQRMLCLKQMGHYVLGVDTAAVPLMWVFAFLNRVACRLGYYYDFRRANQLILKEIQICAFDVIWIEKGLTINPDTLRKIKHKLPSTRLISYCIDDMLLPANQSRNYLCGISLYDVHLTTKTYNVAELKALGAADVQFYANAFDTVAYRPIQLSNDEENHWGSDVAFLGGYESQRCSTMLALAKRGLVITVWGPGWEPYVNIHPNLKINAGWVLAADAAKIFSGTKVNLHFLRKVARDLQTTRSVEIPACGAFMLAERTVEHLGLFTEGVEAEFFDDLEELMGKIQYYIVNSNHRKAIAAAGYQRCIISGYSYPYRLNQILCALIH